MLNYQCALLFLQCGHFLQYHGLPICQLSNRARVIFPKECNTHRSSDWRFSMEIFYLLILRGTHQHEHIAKMLIATQHISAGKLDVRTTWSSRSLIQSLAASKCTTCYTIVRWNQIIITVTEWKQIKMLLLSSFTSAQFSSRSRVLLVTAFFSIRYSVSRVTLSIPTNLHDELHAWLQPSMHSKHLPSPLKQYAEFFE